MKLIGALLLVWIGIKLLLPEEDDKHGRLQSSERLWAAVKTVIVADFVMSLDNVIAIAGSAEGAGGDHKMTLVIFGLLVSIPIIVWGSQLVVRLMDRFPIVITMGGMLLGWIAGEMAMSDPALVSVLADNFRIAKIPQTTVYVAGIIGSLSVLCMGKWFAWQQNREKAEN